MFFPRFRWLPCLAVPFLTASCSPHGDDVTTLTQARDQTLVDIQNLRVELTALEDMSDLPPAPPPPPMAATKAKLEELAGALGKASAEIRTLEAQLAAAERELKEYVTAFPIP